MAIFELQKVTTNTFIKDKAGKPIKFLYGAKNRLAAHIDRVGYVTGLTPEQERAFENQLNLPPKTLDRHPDINGSHAFYDKWFVEVGAAPTKLNDEEPNDALAIHLLRQKPNVGATLADARTNGIEYILTSEDHEAKEAIDGRTYRIKAFSQLDKMTPEDYRNYWLATGHKVAGLSPEAIQDKVGAEAERNPKQFLEVVKDPNLDLKVFVQELLNHGILYKSGSAIVDFASKETFAFRVEDVIQKLQDPDHQPAYIQYQKELKARKKAK